MYIFLKIYNDSEETMETIIKMVSIVNQNTVYWFIPEVEKLTFDQSDDRKKNLSTVPYNTSKFSNKKNGVN